MCTPSLYGIEHSNRKNEEFWGKNRFNSSFPVALSNYMRDRDIKAKYITVDHKLCPKVDEIDIGELYNAKNLKNEELYFSFETRYAPYQKYCYDTIPGIDLTIKDLSENYLRPLEVKLTVTPDNSTAKRPENEWGPEIVFRPQTTIYCVLGMIDSCKDNLDDVNEILYSTCNKIINWDNDYEIASKINTLVSSINDFEYKYYKKQIPLIMQPIWKTNGQNPDLSDNAFDLFVWSDYAFSRLFLQDGETDLDSNRPVSRQQRSAARLARCLYELSSSKKVNMAQIYNQMTFRLQSDKGFSVNGRTTSEYMRCERLINPIIKKEQLFEIILNGGEEQLKPERRFDQTVFFTMKGHKGGGDRS